MGAYSVIKINNINSEEYLKDCNIIHDGQIVDGIEDLGVDARFECEDFENAVNTKPDNRYTRKFKRPALTRSIYNRL